MRSFVLFLIKYFILNSITLLEKKIIKKANKFFFNKISKCSVPFGKAKQKQVISLIISC